MTVRSINGPAACASTVAKLDPSITVAKTGENTLLLNLPRSIEDIDQATQDKSLLSIDIEEWGPIATGGFPPEASQR